HAGAPLPGRGAGFGGGRLLVRRGLRLGGGRGRRDLLGRSVDAGDGDRTDLEGGHLAGGVQRVGVGQRVGAGPAAPVEGREDDVRLDRVSDVRVEAGPAAAGG